MKGSNAKLLPINSVMIALNGQGKTRGTVAMLRVSATCNQSLVSIMPKDQSELLPEFLFANLRSRYSEFRKLTSDDDKDRRGLNMGIIRNIRVPIPPLPEQRRIVSILDEAFAGLEAMRANADKNLQNAREIYQAAVDAMLEQPSPTWLEHPLSNLCAIKHGFAFKSEFFTNAGDCVLLTPGNFLEAGGYRDRGDKQKYYVGPIPDGFVLKEGDLLVAMTEQAPGLLGSPIIVPGESTFLHNQRLGLVQAKRGIPWVNAFFFHVFNARRVRREIHVSGTGTKVRHTSPTKIGEVRVACPTTTSEQSRVADALTRIREESQHLEAIYAQKLAAIDELKHSILQKAFAGELTATAAVAG